MGLTTSRQPKRVARQHISTCNICRYTVYADEPWQLYTQPITGICHNQCVQALDRAEHAATTP